MCHAPLTRSPCWESCNNLAAAQQPIVRVPAATSIHNNRSQLTLSPRCRTAGSAAGSTKDLVHVVQECSPTAAAASAAAAAAASPPQLPAHPPSPPIPRAFEVEVQVQDAALEGALEPLLVRVLPLLQPHNRSWVLPAL